VAVCGKQLRQQQKDVLGLRRVLQSNNMQARTAHIQIEGVTVRAQIKGVWRQNSAKHSH